MPTSLDDEEFEKLEESIIGGKWDDQKITFQEGKTISQNQQPKLLKAVNTRNKELKKEWKKLEKVYKEKMSDYMEEKKARDLNEEKRIKTPSRK